MNTKTKKKFLIGIMGTGHMAGVMLDTIAKMKEVSCLAIASRGIIRAEEMARKYGIERAYGSYEEIVKDSDVDMIYIATLNHLHKENAILCLRNHKPVLVEKPFCLNRKEAEEVFDIAGIEKVFISEAMPIRYVTLSKKIYKNILMMV